jgi:hypothetical protein
VAKRDRFSQGSKCVCVCVWVLRKRWLILYLFCRWILVRGIT